MQPLMKINVCIISLFILGTVESVCDFEKITKIRSLWGATEPKGVLDQLVGTMTYLYIPPVFNIHTPGFKCIKTVLEENKMAEDYHMYEDDAMVVGKYRMKETAFNITMSFTTDEDGDSSDDYVLPVYLNNGVFAFWQCRHDYDPFINIGVLHYSTRKDEEDVKKTIAEAKGWLEQLKMDFPPRITGEC